MELLASIADLIIEFKDYFQFSILFSLVALAKLAKNKNISMAIFFITFPYLLDVLWGVWRAIDYDSTASSFSLLNFNIPNVAYYLIYSLYDALIIGIVLYRIEVFSLLVKGQLKLKQLFLFNADPVVFGYQRHFNEFRIAFIFLVSIVVNLLTAAEYPVRWYINADIHYLYHLYPLLKVILNILLVYCVFRMVYPRKNKNIEGVIVK